jgi:hypothetical protein
MHRPSVGVVLTGSAALIAVVALALRIDVGGDGAKPELQQPVLASQATKGYREPKTLE